MNRPKASASLSDLLPNVLREIRTGGRPSQEEIGEVWRRVSGERASRHSWPRRLSRGRLVVEVDSSGWMFDLSARRVDLLEGLIELLGAARVRELQFRMGEREDAESASKN